MTELSTATLRSGYMREALNLLSINDELLLSNDYAFWRSVAIVVGVQPTNLLVETARAVLDSLSDWDDDYLSEDGDNLSDEAYSDLLAILNEKTMDGARPWTPRDEQLEFTPDEDDEDGARNWEYGVGQQAQPDIRTVLGMMFDKELVVNPEWQRNFVWPIKKQRRFIESILLGLPIPSLLLFEDIYTGTKYVIDGRQRLETLARYCATAEQRQGLPFLGKRFRTFSAKEPYWREGQDLHDAANKYYEQLPPVHRRKIDRAVLTMFTFRSLEPRQLYQIFQRYNTGAEKLKAAEIRNAVYQASPLHQVLWRMAGESPDRMPYLDTEEQYVAETLRNIMQNKTARYGAYDFIGRVMAFTHLDNGKTVAAVTNDFMDQFEDREHESLRQAFLRAFDKVREWYPFPLSTPAQNGKFHGFIGTIQLVTAHHALNAIDAGSLSDSQVRDVIAGGWLTFAQDTLDMKQNSGTFWQRQKEWREQIESMVQGGT